MRATDEQKIKIIELVEKGLTCPEISKEIGLTSSCVRGIISRRNKGINKCKLGKYIFDNSKFDQISTEEEAYWLGFMLGDGSVTKNWVRIELADKDKEHLFKFQKFMNATNPVGKCHETLSYISLNSIDFVKKLTKYGMVKNKTYKKND